MMARAEEEGLLNQSIENREITEESSQNTFSQTMNSVAQTERESRLDTHLNPVKELSEDNDRSFNSGTERTERTKELIVRDMTTPDSQASHLAKLKELHKISPIPESNIKCLSEPVEMAAQAVTLKPEKMRIMSLEAEAADFVEDENFHSSSSDG
jgi:hypothetical protein